MTSSGTMQGWPVSMFSAAIRNGVIEVRILFQVKERNKIIEKNPILIHSVSGLPDSTMVCVA